jgi:hypothetical protein
MLVEQFDGKEFPFGERGVDAGAGVALGQDEAITLRR